MGISVADNFSYLGGKPLDGRIQYATLSDMKAMADATLYEGCEAYCVETDKYYKWKSSNTVDADTGKWREVEGGGGSGLPSGGTQGQYLVKQSSVEGDADWQTLSTFDGATSQSAGSAGLVPAPASGDQTKYLKADGTWATPSGGGGSLPAGGTTGQVLTKKSNADGDADWQTPSTYTRKQIIDKLVLANTYTAYDITITGLEPNTTYTLRETNQSPNLEYSFNSGSLSELEDVYYFHSGATINVIYSIYTKSVTLDSYVKIIDVGLMPTWADGTDAQIAALIARADAGEIDLYTDAGWRVGDERVVPLSAIEATGMFDGVSWTVSESYPAQDIILVLMDAGETSETEGSFANTAATNYSLVTAVKNKDQTARTNPAFLVGVKTTMKNGNNYINGYINATQKASGGWDGTWQNCARRVWCNTAIRQAIPSTLRSIFKQMNVISAGSRTGTTNVTTQDYFSLIAHKELFGTSASSYQPNAAESAALIQFEYFTDSKNRTIPYNSQYGATYWLRSMSKDDDSYWLCGYRQAAAGKDRATDTSNYAPTRFFGAI